MVTTAFVNIWGSRVGAIAWDDATQLGRFEYDPAFRAKALDIAPIKMPIHSDKRVFSFPELRNTFTFNGLPGLLADSLPDNYGNRLIDVWLAEQGRAPNSMNPVEKLCFIGSRGMGALTFEPAKFKKARNTFSVDIDELVELSKKILHEREDFNVNLNVDEKKAMQDILKIGTSAGGMRAKAIIAYNEKTGEVRSGQTRVPSGFEHWLIKLDGVNDPKPGNLTGYGRIEMAYHNMAIDCGIDMMECRLLEEGDTAHFMTKRFDREGSETKHHIQTLCAMQHFDYNDVLSYSYEQLFQTMRMLRLPHPQAGQMFRRMVFNVLAFNCDDHTKNFAFRLKEGSVWELAPAYDVSWSFDPSSRWVGQHALSINGKRKNITENDMLSIAKSIRVKNGKEIVDQIRDTVSRWPVYARQTGVSLKKINEINLVLKSGSD
ncbi:MAG: type II toxin-antitoxin system HipA family toxin [Bacteroidales bacterium]|nr:type II toxin-antitoxin system HipA family toxin [Bacteroidales bacterium]